jgi:tRNA (guanine9-N1)-methyltransferase
MEAEGGNNSCTAVSLSDHDVLDSSQQQKISLRLSKQEKRELKYARIKEARKEKAKEYRRRKSDRVTSEFRAMTDEEIALNKRLRKQEEEAVKERVQKGFEQGLNVCIDLGFDNGDGRELRSLYKQLSLSYGVNRRANVPLHLHVSSLSPSHATALRSQGSDGWMVSKHQHSAVETFPSDKLIILSPDAEEAVTDFDPSKIYVVGGIVDRAGSMTCGILYVCVIL